MISAGFFCIVPINAKYYSDSVAIIPIMGVYYYLSEVKYLCICQ